MCGPYREERAPETAQQKEARLAQQHKTWARRKAELYKRLPARVVKANG